jgi:hypothetical protein
MIIEEEVYLAHYGVKGMKWGVRRAQAKQEKYEALLAADKAKQRYLEETKESRAATKKKVIRVAKGAGVASAIVVGAVATDRLMKAHANKKFVELSKRAVSDRRAYERLLEGKREIQIQALNTAFKSGKITQEQGWRLSSLMDRQLASKLNKSYPRS